MESHLSHGNMRNTQSRARAIVPPRYPFPPALCTHTYKKLEAAGSSTSSRNAGRGRLIETLNEVMWEDTIASGVTNNMVLINMD